MWPSLDLNQRSAEAAYLGGIKSNSAPNKKESDDGENNCSRCYSDLTDAHRQIIDQLFSSFRSENFIGLDIQPANLINTESEKAKTDDYRQPSSNRRDREDSGCQFLFGLVALSNCRGSREQSHCGPTNGPINDAYAGIKHADDYSEWRRALILCIHNCLDQTPQTKAKETNRQRRQQNFAEGLSKYLEENGAEVGRLATFSHGEQC